ncbi:MAG TPA: NADH-quinone oxidoreductase subunit NuoH [Dehalococcoidia bacterium]|nr:NADH-quinone oxidoreductase subunit NuoH [Dehalococcoidia bacterium]
MRLLNWYDFDPFRELYEWLAKHTEDWVVYLVSAIVGCVGILTFVGLGALINVWLERRIIGRMQVRRGPNRVGPWGLLQPVADAIKLIQKEVLQPDLADSKLFSLPPILVFIPAMLSFAVFAWAPDMVLANLDVGVLYLLALSSITALAVFIAGWASNNKYALLGAMRVIAMMVSYEAPMVMALLGPVLFVGTMSVAGLVAWQSHYGPLAIYVPISLVVYIVSATAELNRTPADIAEAESEIVAGYHTEYSGMKWGLFYAVELVNSLAVSAIVASLFFGGWWLGGLEEFVPPWIIFIVKTYIFYFGLIWLRGTLPRFRIDQLMALAWKMLLPLGLINAGILATEVLIWREADLGDWVLAVFAVVNIALAAGLLILFFRVITARLYRLPRRPVLVPTIQVPSLPAPKTTASLNPPAAAP